MRLHVPFDVFGMREEVRVSSLVRAGDLGWTCGQCPLDRDGAVVAPHDLLAQASFVCDMIGAVLPRGLFDPGQVGKLDVYFDDAGTEQGAAALALIGDRFPQALIVPIPVPAFYYEGMRIEVDVFAAATAESRRSLADAPALEIVEVGDLTWAYAEARLSADETCADGVRAIAAALETANLFEDRLLCDHWSASRSAMPAPGKTLQTAPYLSMPDRLILRDRGRRCVAADLTFSTAPVTRCRIDRDGVSMILRTAGPLCTIQATQAGPGRDLVAQTGAIMSAVAAELAALRLSFADVVKVSAPYVGAATAEDLHRNLSIRHRHYLPPGPASTGLRVAGLHHPKSLIAITVIAVR